MIDIGGDLVTYIQDPELKRLMAEVIQRINAIINDHEDRLEALE